MSTTVKQYSPSINIKRDRRKSLNYIPTPNAKDVAKQVLGGLNSGVRSHVIVGAYGSGKSIFLWAFAKTLAQSKSYFSLPTNMDLGRFHIINLVGEYGSVMEAFAQELNVGEDYDTDSILDALQKEYDIQQAKKRNLLLVIDEFGKFLEYAAIHNPDEELYFVQELAEFVNDENRKVLLIASLHQNFSAYGYRLTKQQQSEWTKVQGRFNEVTFNEPVEQLLFLASERLSIEQLRKPSGFVPLFKAIKRSRSFPLRDYLTEDIAQKLYPLDILSAAVLTLALQRYGQNERSLFSFLENSDHLGVAKKRRSNFYSVADVYDYIKHSFSIINTKHNPHYIQWGSIASSLERAEGVFDSDLEDAEALIKTIGLLGIFGSGAMMLDDDFLEEYGKRALGIRGPKSIIKRLSDHRIIRYTKYNKRYILFEGTDLDIEVAIDEAGNLVEKIGSIAEPLKEYFEFQVVLAKSAYYKKGTPRFFEYVVSDDIANVRVTDEVDGFINLIFSDHLSVEELVKEAKKLDSPVLYCLYENTTEIQKILFDIKKVEKVIETNQEDRVAVRELKNILNHQKRLLNHYVLDTFRQDGKVVRWIDAEGECVIKDERAFNKRLSHICHRVYHATPTFSSELTNKTKLSGAIRTAQKEFIRHMIGNYTQKGWGFDEHRFPPAKSIYYSLVWDKGIAFQAEDDVYSLGCPTETSFSFLWDKCSGFLESTRLGKRSLRELVEILAQPPLKLKYGFSQFWLPLFLFIKRNDFALYHEEAYIPNITSDTLELVLKYPHQYYIKAFQVEGIDLELFKYYRRLVQQEEAAPNNATLIETIRPFLRLYRDLPEYSKRTNRISKEAQRLRESIAQAKDPEALFLRDIPTALGTSKKELLSHEERAEAFVNRLEKTIKELRTSFEALESRFSNHIQTTLGYRDVQKGIQRRFESLQVSLLSRKQRSFYQRLVSDLEFSPWLSALCQALLGKGLKKLLDEEEAILYRTFTRQIEELDNVCDISKVNTTNVDAEDIILVDIQGKGKERTRRVLQLTSLQKNQVKSEKDAILAVLGNDKTISAAVLAEVLKELLDE